MIIRLLISLILILFLAKSNYAQIVMFPFVDFTDGVYAINFEIPEELAIKLSEKGYQVISPKEVLSFLFELKKPNFTDIDFVLLREIYEKFNAQYILLGTIGNMQKDPPAITLIVKLIEVGTGKVVWGEVLSYSPEDFVSFLGLKKVNYKIMMERVYQNLLSGFREPIISMNKIEPAVEVYDVFFNSRYVRSGETVECVVKLAFSGPDPVFLGLEVEDKYGKRVIPLNRYVNQKSYIAFWKSPDTEGEYPIYLVAIWNGKWDVSKKIFLGKYFVDNTPPSLNLVIKGATVINGKVLVKDVLEIIPKVVGSSSANLNGKGNGVSRWGIDIFSKAKNELILSQVYSGELPNYLTWYAKSGANKLLPGEYKIKFKVWDLAGNYNEVEKEVLLITDPNEPQVFAYVGKDRSWVEIKIDSSIVPLRKFYLEIYDKDGKRILDVKEDGEVNINGGFKKELEVNGLDSVNNLFFNAYLEDSLKNKKFLRKKPVIITKINEDKNKEGVVDLTPSYETWVNEF